MGLPAASAMASARVVLPPSRGPASGTPVVAVWVLVIDKVVLSVFVLVAFPVPGAVKPPVLTPVALAVPLPVLVVAVLTPVAVAAVAVLVVVPLALVLVAVAVLVN